LAYVLGERVQSGKHDTKGRSFLWPVLSGGVLCIGVALGLWGLVEANRQAVSLERTLRSGLQKDAERIATEIQRRIESELLSFTGVIGAPPPERLTWRRGELISPDQEITHPKWITLWFVVGPKRRVLNPVIPPFYLTGGTVDLAMESVSSEGLIRGLKAESNGNLQLAHDEFIDTGRRTENPTLRWQAWSAAAALSLRLRQYEQADLDFELLLSHAPVLTSATVPTRVQMKIAQSEMESLRGSRTQHRAGLLDLGRAIVDGREICANPQEEQWVFHRIEKSLYGVNDHDLRGARDELREMAANRNRTVAFYSPEWIGGFDTLRKTPPSPRLRPLTGPSGEKVVAVPIIGRRAGELRLLVASIDVETLFKTLAVPARIELDEGDALEFLPNNANDSLNQMAALSPPFDDLRLSLNPRTAGVIARRSDRQRLLTSAAALALSTALAGGLIMLIRHTRKALELSRLKGQFVAGVTHELKTPLSLIRMFNETLEHGRIDDPSKVQEYHSIIGRETERLDRLINNILDSAQIDSGVKEFRYERISLGDLIRETAASYEQAFQQEGFEAEIDIQDSMPEIRADREAICQSVMNLIDNAMKYSANEKKIAIRCWSRNGDVFVSVTDRGIGVADRERRRIFQEFQRGVSDAVQRSRGAGLGLALARNIVVAHGGDIDLDSRLGQGSTFTIRLPARGPDQ
jgi:signal transduction histidine kinase